MGKQEGKPKIAIMGDIWVADEYDPGCPNEPGPINKYPFALLLEFPDGESLRLALQEKKVEFKHYGE